MGQFVQFNLCLVCQTELGAACIFFSQCQKGKNELDTNRERVAFALCDICILGCVYSPFPETFFCVEALKVMSDVSVASLHSVFAAKVAKYVGCQ